jgi:polycystin 2
MFLAIINDTYGEVKSEIVKSEIELSNFIKKGYNKMLDRYNIKRDRIIDIQQALNKADLNSDNQVDFDELRSTLKVSGFFRLMVYKVFLV